VYQKPIFERIADQPASNGAKRPIIRSVVIRKQPHRSKAVDLFCLPKRDIVRPDSVTWYNYNTWERRLMKAYMLMTGSGPIVVLTSHASILDSALIEKLADKGIEKFIAYEIPIDLAEQCYGTHFAVVRGDLRETDDLRVLDEDGERAFKLFRFDELGPSLAYEPASAAS
jgi:hypothetical protein